MRGFINKNLKYLVVGAILLTGIVFYFRPFMTELYEPGRLENQHWQRDEETVLVFAGDSIVAGYGVSQDFPAILEEKVRESQLHHITIYNEGVDGYATDDVLRELPRLLDTLEPGVLFFHMGWNDYRKSRNVEVFEDNYRQILELTQEKGTIPVMMTTTRVNIPLANRGIREYNAIIKDLAREFEVPLLNLYSVWEKEGRVTGMDSLLLNDNIHPSFRGHQLIAQTIWDEFFRYHFPFLRE